MQLSLSASSLEAMRNQCNLVPRMRMMQSNDPGSRSLLREPRSSGAGEAGVSEALKVVQSKNPKVASITNLATFPGFQPMFILDSNVGAARI